MNPEKDQNRTVSARLPDSVFGEIEKAAKKDRRTISFIIREALVRVFKPKKG